VRGALEREVLLLHVAQERLLDHALGEVARHLARAVGRAGIDHHDLVAERE
jgi:hypothetical protein